MIAYTRICIFAYIFLGIVRQTSTYSDFVDAILDSKISEDMKTLQEIDNNSTGSTLSNRRAIITFVNGIYHSPEDWKKISDDILNIFSNAYFKNNNINTKSPNNFGVYNEKDYTIEVRPFYYPSSGSWFGDLSTV
jgi:hypothetical protein